jgi:hypothetical protein
MSVVKKGIVLAGLGLSLLTTVGCQTWIPEAGVTMPSAEWLLHPPQFFPPSPPFPLPRELKGLRDEARVNPATDQPPAGVNPGP